MLFTYTIKNSYGKLLPTYLPVDKGIVTFVTLDPFARTGSGLVHLCGRSSMGTRESPVARHRHPPL